MLLSQRLEKLTQTSKGSTRSIALYLLRKNRDACFLTMREVAEGTQVSKPTLVRFAQGLGFDGWGGFFEAYRREISSMEARGSHVDHGIPFGEEASTSQIIEAISQVRSESDYETGQIQDAEQVARAVGMLAEARRIVLLGVSVNALCLQLFQRKLLQLGIDAVLPAQAEFGLVAQTLKPGDIVLAISYTGESGQRTPMKHLATIRAQGAGIVAITSEGENYLRDHADVVLTIVSREALYAKIATFSTEASIMCLLDILYAGVFARDYRSNLASKSSTSKLVEFRRRPV